MGLTDDQHRNLIASPKESIESSPANQSPPCMLVNIWLCEVHVDIEVAEGGRGALVYCSPCEGC